MSGRSFCLPDVMRRIDENGVNMLWFPSMEKAKHRYWSSFHDYPRLNVIKKNIIHKMRKNNVPCIHIKNTPENVRNSIKRMNCIPPYSKTLWPYQILEKEMYECETEEKEAEDAAIILFSFSRRPCKQN